MKKKAKFKYRYFHTFNGVIEERFTNDLNNANNSSLNSGMPYFEILSSGKEKEIKPTYIMTDNLIDNGFHNRILRKNK